MFHKAVAWSIVLFSVIHSVGHYVNYYRMEKQTEGTENHRSAQYLAIFSGPGFTGHVLVLILFLMVTSSVGRYQILYICLFALVYRQTLTRIPCVRSARTRTEKRVRDVLVHTPPIHPVFHHSDVPWHLLLRPCGYSTLLQELAWIIQVCVGVIAHIPPGKNDP